MESERERERETERDRGLKGAQAAELWRKGRELVTWG